MQINLKQFYRTINKCYWDFFEDRSRIRLLYGSAGSGKSFYSFQEMIYRIIVEDGQNYLIIRKVANTHRTSTYALTQQVISSYNLWSLFKENKADMTFTCLHNKNMIIFKGMDNREKLKSVTAKNGPITSVICEEATELSLDDFNQINVRLRGNVKVPFTITLLFNPISTNHWLYKEFFLKKSFQKNFKVNILKTIYLQNEYLDEDYRQVLESYKDIDEQFYRVYCLAEFGIYGDVIFNNYCLDSCPYEEYDFDSIYAGIDFGFVHPTVLIKLGFKDGTLYAYNELCVFEKTNKEFIEVNEEFNILHKGEVVVCDSAEPSKIKELVQHGYGAIAAFKGKDSITRGIDFLKSQKFIVDPNKCPRLAQELEQYHWKKDKDGNVIEKPVELFDDAIHCCFYALESLSRSKPKPSVLSGKFTDNKKKIMAILKEQRKEIRLAKKEQYKFQRELNK